MWVLAGDEGDLEHDLFHAHLSLALFVNLMNLAQERSPTDSLASPQPAVHHPAWMLICGPTRLRYGGFTSFTELVKSGFAVAFFLPDIGVE